MFQLPNTRIFEKHGLQVVILDNSNFRFERQVDNHQSILICDGPLPVLLPRGENDLLSIFVTIYELEHGPELRNVLSGRI